MSEAEKFQQSTNALKWAEAFIEHKHRNSWTAEDIDEGLMLGWFANAMMVRHDRVKSDTRKATLDTIKEMRDDRIKRANAVWDNPIGHSAALNDLQGLLNLEASIIDEVINKLEGEQ